MAQSAFIIAALAAALICLLVAELLREESATGREIDDERGGEQ